MAFSTVSVSCPLLSVIWTLVIGFRAYLDNPGSSHLEILNLITSTNTFFPYKVTFTSSWGYDIVISFWGATIQPTTLSIYLSIKSFLVFVFSRMLRTQ